MSESEFPHEREGLELIRAALPDRAPYRAWANFEFRDRSGKWHEVDLLVLGERRLHLVELKHYRGRITGSAYRWQRHGRSEDSPLLLARRKAQRLKSVIVEALRDLGAPAGAAPFVQECIFLHAADSVCALQPGERTDLFGRDGATAASGLSGISQRLLEPPDPAADRRPRLIEDDRLAERLFDRIGFTQRREPEVGSWRIVGPPDADGDGWQDWPVEHRVSQRDRRTVRFFVMPSGRSIQDQTLARQAVQREYELTSRLQHDGVLAPRDLVDADLGPGLVFDRTGDDRRLDLWMTDRPVPLALEQRLKLVRQVAEALGYAHRHHVVHRGLTPETIWMSARTTEPNARIGDWQQAGEFHSTMSPVETGLATRLFREAAPSSDYLERQAGAYFAPEGRWDPGVDRVRLDVFGLGAVAYLILTDAPPAAHAQELRERLKHDGGLDLAAHLPAAPEPLRRLVLDATKARVSDRLGSVADFLARLDAAEQAATVDTDDGTRDPLEARAGARLDDRFTLVGRLGSGSTAVGLLVSDVNGRELVLKVAKDDQAATRLETEARVLRNLPTDPHLIASVEPEPVRVGTRTALVLEPAGPTTLAAQLRGGTRLSLDLLQRYGDDLLRALVALERAGVDHRDIKPANLGIRERRKNREKHLVLFDFSLSAASVDDLGAGTRPYLDPFLRPPARPRWDSAAERYAAAVTLFEMATGRTPTYGDDATAPDLADADVTIAPELFDESIRPGLANFFGRALARDVSDRQETATELLAAWKAVWDADSTRLGDVESTRQERADRAVATTLLRDAGLSPRALSAIEPLDVHTVGELVAIESGRLTSLRGSSAATRDEVKDRAKHWRAKFGRFSYPSVDIEVVFGPGAALGDVAERFVACVRTGAKERGRLISAILGVGDVQIGAWATLRELGRALGGRTEPQMHRAIDSAVALLSNDDDCRAVLDAVTARMRAVVSTAGGLLPAALLGTELVPGDDDGDRRVVDGLARLALERADHNQRAGGEEPPVARRRRRRDAAVLLATPAALLDIAAPLAELTDAMLDSARSAGDAVVPAARASVRLREVWPAGVIAPDDATLARLAVRLTTDCAATPQGELYRRDLPVAAAARIALAGYRPAAVAPTGDPSEFVDRIRTRFPDLADVLPRGSELDTLLAEAGVDVRRVGDRYEPLPRPGSTTGLTGSTGLTSTSSAPSVRPADDREQRLLDESRDSASFLALGVPARYLSGTATRLVQRYDARPFDLTGEVIGELRAAGERAGIGWDDLAAADAAESGSRPALGLARLVEHAMPIVLDRVAALVMDEAPARRPVLLTDAAALARYGHLAALTRFTDLAAVRSQAVWLLFPLPDNHAAEIDDVPLPLAHGGQFLVLEQGVRARDHMETSS